MVIMARSIVRGRVCRAMTMMAAELPKMAAILQTIGGQGHAALVYHVRVLSRVFEGWKLLPQNVQLPPKNIVSYHNSI